MRVLHAERLWRRLRAIRVTWKVLVVALLADALMSFLVSGAMGGPRLDYHVGDVVRSEIIASEPLSVVDAERTDEARQLASDAVLPVFDYAADRNTAVVDSLETSLANLRGTFAAASSGGRRAQSAESFAKDHVADFPLGDEASLVTFARHEFAASLSESVLDALRRRSTGYILGDDVAAHPQLVVRNVATNDSYPVLFRDVVRLSEAKDGLRADISRISALHEAEQTRLASTLASLIAPTLVPNPNLTAAARRDAGADVPDVLDEYRAGDVIAYRNQPVDARISRALAALALRSQAPNRAARIAAIFLFIGIALLALWSLAGRAGNGGGLSQPGTFLMMTALLLAQLALTRLGAEIVGNYTVAPRGALHASPQYLFAIPFAAAPLVAALLLDGSFALFAGLALAPLVALMTAADPGGGTALGMYSIVGAASVMWTGSRYRTRLVVFQAGLSVLAGNVVGVGIVSLMSVASSAPISVHLANLGAAAESALVAGGFAALALPVAERVFGVLTDVRLLELAHADSWLLRELAIRAPGTHQHSFVMSSVANEAAKAIGANPLLARVGAYYHDIGKLHAPEMFVENQQGGPNPHDGLEPVESARLILRHVSYGVELAKEHGLPPQVIEMITGHHGTRSLHFFLEKAKEQLPPGVEIDERLFRYPGPKPQTREAAILMLSDGCEAAVRSLDDPSRPNVAALVGKIADTVVGDHQLEECGITLSDVARVRDSIVDTLVSLHHRRIKYPGFNAQVEPHTASEVGSLD